MKFNVGDKVTVVTKKASLSVAIEDASKSDIIQAKVEGVNNQEGNTYEVGKVYSFSRKDITEP